MAIVKFPGAYIRHSDLRKDKGSGSWYARIDMSCTLTQPLSVSLDCLDMIDNQSAGGVVDLKSVRDHHIKSLVLGVEGMPQSLHLEGNVVTDFKYVNHFDDEGKVESRELRFHVRAPSAAILLVHGYVVDEVDQTPGLMEIETTTAPEQTPVAHQTRIDGGEDPVMPDAPKRRGKGSKNRPKTDATASASVEPDPA